MPEYKFDLGNSNGREYGPPQVLVPDPVPDVQGEGSVVLGQASRRSLYKQGLGQVGCVAYVDAPDLATARRVLEETLPQGQPVIERTSSGDVSVELRFYTDPTAVHDCDVELTGGEPLPESDLEAA